MRKPKTEGPCVLIIDEINRANLARVFGELMYLLEYREPEIPLSSGGELPFHRMYVSSVHEHRRPLHCVGGPRSSPTVCLSGTQAQLRGTLRFHQHTRTSSREIGTTWKNTTSTSETPTIKSVLPVPARRPSGQIEDIWQMEIEPYLEEYFFDQPENAEKFRWERIA